MRQLDRFPRNREPHKDDREGIALDSDNLEEWRVGKNIGHSIPTTPLDESTSNVTCAEWSGVERRARYRLVAHLTVVWPDELAHSVRGAARCSFSSRISSTLLRISARIARKLDRRLIVC